MELDTYYMIHVLAAVLQTWALIVGVEMIQ